MINELGIIAIIGIAAYIFWQDHKMRAMESNIRMLQRILFDIASDKIEVTIDNDGDICARRKKHEVSN